METRETITLDARTQHRLFVVTQIIDGRLDVESGARLLQLSVRQVRRLAAALRSGGAAGLVHGNHGRQPVHRTPDRLRSALIELATTTYAGVNRAHLADLLVEREGITIAERTLRRILDEAGIAPSGDAGRRAIAADGSALPRPVGCFRSTAAATVAPVRASPPQITRFKLL